MAESYDHMAGEEQDADRHPDNNFPTHDDIMSALKSNATKELANRMEINQAAKFNSAGALQSTYNYTRDRVGLDRGNFGHHQNGAEQ